MIEHVIIFLPTGERYGEYEVGKNAKKIFFDREDKSTLVITQKEDILTLRGFIYVCQKAYKE